MINKQLTEFKELLQSIKPIEMIYDNIRIVDPLAKKVFSFDGDNLVMTKLSCYDFWGRNKICCNCISLRAIKESDTFVKIETNNKEAFMVTAIPFTIGNTNISIEILKNITTSFFLVNSVNNETIEVYSLINNINVLAVKDALTEIYNRRYINERLPVDLINASLNSEPLSLIMADIDFFKNVNDEHGHIGGDFIIKSFARILSNYASQGKNWVARYGGEEFIICLNNNDSNEALEIAEKIRQDVEKEEFIFNNKIIKITASFGIGTTKKGCIETFDEIIGLADKNMYKAKNSGRNNVVVD